MPIRPWGNDSWKVYWDTKYTDYILANKGRDQDSMTFKKTFTCIMIKTNDKRYFFTYKKHLKHVTEYFKTFGAEVFLVKATNIQVLELDQLVKNLCDTNKNQNNVKHNIIKRLYPIKAKSRKDVQNSAKKIKEYIETQFINEEVVSLKKLRNKFHDMELSDSCLSNHLSQVRKSLETQGYKISRIGLGKYKINPLH